MAINKYIQNPKINNIQFVELDAALSPDYHTLPMDREWYYNNILSYQFQQKYLQPIQLSDEIELEFHRTDNNGVGLEILGCDGEVLETLSSVDNFAQAGHTYLGEQLWTNTFRFNFNDYSLTEGYYYIRVFAQFFDGEEVLEETLYYISEPLDLKVDHRDTVLLECYDESNKHNYIWFNSNIIRPTARLRVQGFLLDMRLSSNLIDFKEQDYQQRTINRTGWRNFKLFIGSKSATNGGVGIPPYMADKVNEYLDCDVINIEGRRYVVDEGNLDIESITGSDEYPLVNGQIQVREYEKLEGSEIRKDTLRLVLLPDAPPYSIYQLSLQGTQFIPQLLASYKVPDGTAETAMLTFLASRATAYRQGGVYTIDDDRYLVYQQAIGENYALAGDTIICTDVFEMGVTIANNGDEFVFNLREGYADIDFGDGGTDVWEHHPLFNSSNQPIYYAHSFVYPTAGTYTITVYCTGTVKAFRCDGVTPVIYNGKLNNLTGSLPTLLSDFHVRNQNFSGLAGTGFDMLPFVNCIRWIKSIRLLDSQLQGLDGTIFADYKYTVGLTGTYYWELLNSLSFSGNAFSVSEVNSLVNDYFDNTPVGVAQITPGLFNILMSPPAVTTGTAVTKLATMTANGWSVIKN